MKYILRKTTIHTMEMVTDIDDEDKTPEQLRSELNMLGYLHGWKESMGQEQITLTKLNEDDGELPIIVGKWSVST